jgi:membrane-bound lytic murein transglycosylase B
MSDGRTWWRLLSSSAVLGILVVAVLAGVARTTVSAGFAVRVPVAAVVDATRSAAVVPGPIIAPYEARRATASFGAVAYVPSGTALTYSDIPPRALEAYQRSASVIDLADDKCHLDWELLAAHGKVGSDHGRVDGASIDEEGVARPAVLGPRLSGRHGTERVGDTDAGEVDGAAAVDRVVGPMMLLPATWSLVAVDGDSDGRRDPQDVDDATLATAVFLCAGPGDLRKAARARDQVGRFHAGADYARAVFRVRAEYRAAGVLPTAESLMVRQNGVLSTVDPVAADEAAGESSYDAGATYESPQPTATTSTEPTSAPTGAATPAGPTAGPTSSASASPTPSPTADPSPTSEPTTTPTAEPSCDPSPTSEPTASPTTDPGDGCGEDPPPPSDPTQDPEPTVLASGTAVLVLPGGAWLWWRRRRDPA